MKKVLTGNEKNIEVRKAIQESGLKYYEVAELLDVHPCTLTSWLSRKLPTDKAELILNVLSNNATE